MTVLHTSVYGVSHPAPAFTPHQHSTPVFMVFHTPCQHSTTVFMVFHTPYQHCMPVFMAFHTPHQHSTPASMVFHTPRQHSTPAFMAFHTPRQHFTPAFMVYPGAVLGVLLGVPGAGCHVGQLPVAGQPLLLFPHHAAAVHWLPHPDSLPLPVPVLSGCAAQG